MQFDTLIINGKIDGNISTGMTYYPYLEYGKKIDSAQPDNLNENNIKLGCFVTFNEMWLNPFYNKTKNSNNNFEGIEIGIWNTN